nr:uncharacterized protein LOC109748681 [Aegilops tauschii subsp. strangulata]XP_020163294.2 uncharacterized protein LOC109748681 [Aegilops tauschii subsp. strangulata]
MATVAGPGPRCAPDTSRVRAAAAPAAGPTAARCRASMATVAGPGPRSAPPTPPGSVPPQLPAPPPPSTGPGSPLQGGVPIQQVRFPPSPSPIPAWLTGSSPSPVYTSAGDPPAPTLQFGDPSDSAGYSMGRGHADQAPQSSLLRTSEPVGHGAPTQTPPRFAKLDFATYDGTEDPLNWLNQCEQFFCGQRTLASERTWLASYHLRGAAQTWYYALEQDEGSMPPWERFRELCLLRFGPPIRGSRLAELGRLPFTSTVQDLADRFQDLACHASGVMAQQRADLFVGGLPDHIRVDVELRGPQDLQTAMYYARAFERRAVAIQQESPSRAAGSLPWPDVPAQGRLLRLSRHPSQRPRHARSAGSPRPNNSSVTAKGCASNATSPTRPATSARDSSTWRLQTTFRRTPSPPTWPPQLSRRCLMLVDHLEEFSKRFSTLQLEDELFVQVGRSVMTGILGA